MDRHRDLAEPGAEPDGAAALLAKGSAVSFASLLEDRCRATPEAPMLVDGAGDRVTFAQYRLRVGSTAAWLADNGVGPGQTVCWQLPGSVGALVAYGALSYLGATQVPLLGSYGYRELAAVFAAARPALVLVPEGRARGRIVAALEAAAPDARLLDVEPDPRGRRGQGPAAPGGGRYLYATSGSTGAPKLVRHDDASLIAWALAQSSAQGVTAEDAVAYVLSLAHVAGSLVVNQALSCGNRALVLESFRPETTPDQIADHGTSVLVSIPVVYAALVQAQRAQGGPRMLPRLRFCASGTGPKPASLRRDVEDVLGGRLLTSYGMTETGAIAVASPTDTDEQLERAVGRPLPGLDVRIVHQSGRPAVPGDVGEIRVKGATVTSGYLDDAMNRLAFDPDGYLRTGDLGRLREDGHLELTGRLKEIIIRKGENVVPGEVEALLGSMPGVRDVVVVGVPDPQVGERVCAAVVPTDGRRPGLREIADHCRSAGLMAQKIPEQLALVDEIPRTAAGKPDLPAVRALLTEQRA